MNQNKENVFAQIVEFAKEYKADKVILFGSRARGDNKEKSDIDIAVYGCNNFDELKVKVEEDLWSLLRIDIINMDSCHLSEELIKEIDRDGVILYEKLS